MLYLLDELITLLSYEILLFPVNYFNLNIIFSDIIMVIQLFSLCLFKKAFYFYHMYMCMSVCKCICIQMPMEVSRSWGAGVIDSSTSVDASS